jgi:hypothetical protein
MREELKALFGREVDLVEKAALRNPFRRAHILKSSEVIYAALRPRSRFALGHSGSCARYFRVHARRNFLSF